ncbi:MAG: hypothetical protein KatS3mg115_1795 [Candidatus Poribacteria bacterium]|nr:MAG: hypothetical protein KatS3mg115_1795 [Candidatus Poribacteria bacterium]
MYDAPLRFAMPNDRLPAFNDSREVNLHGQRALYELAYARYRDPAYLSLLASGPRESELAVWFGEPRLPEPPERRWSSANYPDSGYGILSFGTGTSATWLCLKYGPHGGGHGHPDKLNFVLYADGGLIAPDPGTARYGHPLQGGWYRATVAHNTLVVDEENQQPATGRDLLFETTPEYTLLRADAGEIHPEVRFQRTVALIGAHTIVIEDVVRSEEEHRYDIAYHQLGEWVELPAGDPWSPPERPGYRYFRDATVRQASGGELVVLRGRVEEDRYATVSLLAEEPTEVITATGIGEHLEDRVPLVLFRRRARSTRYLWAISLDFRPVELKRAPDDSVLIVTPEGASWRFSDGSLERQAEPTE